MQLGRNRHFTLRAAPGDGAPAADPGPDVDTTPGSVVALSGDASCDPDGDALTPSWRLLVGPGREHVEPRRNRHLVAGARTPTGPAPTGSSWS